MKASRWQRIEDLFERAVELDAGERRGLLDEQCRGDDELRREVEEMLEGEAVSSWIGTSVRRTVLSELGDEPPPTRIGVYRVIREIGRGGLATVFLGERDDDEYHLQVAIKLLRRGLDTADQLSRLRQERQILARLDHPNIARLIDGGTADDGRPFVVMEFIDGQPIDVYCRQNQLPLRERLLLFTEVCDAVAFAHRNLVIHRDIKPQNILVASPKTSDKRLAMAQSVRFGPVSADELISWKVGQHSEPPSDR